MTPEQADTMIGHLATISASVDVAVASLAFVLAGVKACFCGLLVTMFFTGLQALKR